MATFALCHTMVQAGGGEAALRGHIKKYFEDFGSAALQFPGLSGKTPA